MLFPANILASIDENKVRIGETTTNYNKPG